MKNIAEQNIWKNWTNAQMSDLIHEFTMKNYELASRLPDYGLGQICTPVEAHLLKRIYENPGITMTQLSFKLHRSKGAISQIVKKLESKGLIVRGNIGNDKKRVALTVTQLGEDLTIHHIAYDEKVAGMFFNTLTTNFSDEEMNIFFCVLNKYSENMDN